MEKILHVQYSSIWAFYWAYYGIMSSFGSLFLVHKGFDNYEIGVMFALANILSVVIQPPLADWADRSKKLGLHGILQCLTVLLIGFTALLFVLVTKSWALLGVYALLIAFHSALQGLINSMTFRFQETGQYINFGLCRAMGSLVFSTTVLFIGFLTKAKGADVLPLVGLISMVLLLVALQVNGKQYKKAVLRKIEILKAEKLSAMESEQGKDKNTVSAASFPEENVVASANEEATAATQGEALSSSNEEATASAKGETKATPNEEAMASAQGKTATSTQGLPEDEAQEIGLLAFLKDNRMFLLMSMGVVCLFFGNQALNNFLYQIIDNVGGDRGQMGTVACVMGLLEIPPLMAFGWLQKKIKVTTLLKIAGIGFVVKATIIWMAKDITLVYVSVLFQPVSFALILPAMVYFINTILRKGEAIKGQAWFITSTAIGAILASYFGGWIMEAKDVSTMLLVCTWLAVVGAVILFLTIDKIPVKTGKGNDVKR